MVVSAVVDAEAAEAEDLAVKQGYWDGDAGFLLTRRRSGCGSILA